MRYGNEQKTSHLQGMLSLKSQPRMAMTPAERTAERTAGRQGGREAFHLS